MLAVCLDLPKGIFEFANGNKKREVRGVYIRSC